MVRETEANRKEDSTDNPDNNDDDGNLAVDYETLWYIELRGDGDKRPAKTWGGYSQDFSKAEHVLRHEEIVDHPSDEWGVVDCTTWSLLIFDIDSYKSPDNFDVGNRFSTPDNTLVTRSQSGGNHVYFVVDVERGELNESDFEVHEDLPFDIDIRGSAVSHHVVAPQDIPGAGGPYKVVNDESIKAEFGPGEACSRITFDGEPAIKYSNETTPDIDFDRPEEPPEDMPTCYHAGLSLRAAAPEDPDLNTHKVNVLTALCGLAAGYDVESVVSHMCCEYAPVDGDTDVSDKEETNYQVRHLKEQLESGYAPPAYSTLREYGILNDNEVCGVDCPIDMHKTSEEWAALRTVEEFIEEFPPILNRDDENPAHDPEDDRIEEVADATVTLTEEDYKEHVGDIVSRVQRSREMVDQHRYIAHTVEDRGARAYHHGGELVAASKPGESPWWATATLLNFRLDVESILDIEGEDRMAQVHVETTEPTESDFDLEIEPRTFNDARRFKDTVLAQRFSTVIEAPMRNGDVMDLIRQYVAALDVPIRSGQYGMGLSDDCDEFVTPNGTIGPNGWTDDPDAVHVEQGGEKNNTTRSFTASPEENTDVDSDAVAKMIELVSQSRELDRIAAILGWFYAAPHRPQITDQTGQFNPMNVTGRSGAGKTATLAALNQMFGMDTEPQSAEASKHATLTGFASSKGVPVWFDEYRPENMADYIADRFHTMYKKAATGGVEPRGNQSMGTDDWHLRSPVVVSGESEIRDSAERRRTVNVTVSKAPTKDGHPAKEAFKALVGDVTVDDEGNVQFPDANFALNDHAVAYYASIAGMSDDEFRRDWFGARETVAELLDEWGDDVDLGDMEIQALQTVAFGFERMLAFAGEVGADMSELPTREDLEAALRLVADVDGDGRQPQEHQFLSLVSRAAAADYLEADTDYRVVHEGKPNEDLRVNVTRAFDKVSKFARDHALNEDLLQSAADYKDRFGQLEEEDTFVTTTSQPTPPINRCVGVDMSRAVEDVVGFARESFVETVSLDEGEDAGSDGSDGDGDGDGPTPVKELDPDETDTGYATVTVRATTWNDGDDAPLQLTGTVKDETGPVRVVSFDEVSTPVDEDECIRIKDAFVDDYDGRTQLVIEDGTTKIESIQPGAGHTAPVDTPDDQAGIESGSQTGLPDDDADETINDDGEREDTGGDAPGQSGDAQEVQDAARADGGTIRSDVQAIDHAALQHADGVEALGVLAGRVSHATKCDDLDQIKHRIEKLRDSGDITLRDCGSEDNEGDVEPDVEVSENTSSEGNEDNGRGSEDAELEDSEEIPAHLEGPDGLMTMGTLAADIHQDARERDDGDTLRDKLGELADTGDELPASAGKDITALVDTDNKYASNRVLVRSAVNALLDAGYLDEFNGGEA